NRLKQEIASLRRQLEPPGIPAGAVLIADRFTLRLNPATVTTDMAALQSALHDAARVPDVAVRIALLQDAAALCEREFLPGHYDNWVMNIRAEVSEIRSQILEQLTTNLESVGDLPGAIACASRLITHDPLREDAHLNLMRLYAAAGRTAEARRQFQEM